MPSDPTPADAQDRLNALIPDADERLDLWKRVWAAYYEQYNAFRQANPGWQAFFTDHHGSSLDAALQVFGSELIARGFAEGRRQATEGWEREYAYESVGGITFPVDGDDLLRARASIAVRAADGKPTGRLLSRVVGPWETAEQPEPAEEADHG